MKKSQLKRGAGILLHISSLPNSYGIGTLGKEAFEFVDFLHASGQRYWQILPLSPVGFTSSPYQSNSALTSNHYFLDLEQLLEQGLLSSSDLKSQQQAISSKINFKKLYPKKDKVLAKAFDKFDTNKDDFVSYSACSDVLEYACYMTLKDLYGGTSWHQWQDEHKYFSRSLITRIRKQNPHAVDFFIWQQYEFDRQWKKLKDYANSKNINIIGDIPIYVGYDSVECWTRPHLFQLDERLNPTHVAGVPPDYFSATGQLWGNPLYDWEHHLKTSFSFWKKRVKYISTKCDYVRIDHFRAFHEYYSIKADADTAINGSWHRAAGKELFSSLPKSTTKKIIAEDLGWLDEGALNFFAELGFPGMKVLQFAFDGNQDNPHLPQNCQENSVIYSGTHDNDTLKGWLLGLGDKANVKKRIKQAAQQLGLLGKQQVLQGENTPKNQPKSATISPKTIDDYCDLLINIALFSRSDICIIPIQDYLHQGSRHRMNTPSTVDDANWAYRLESIPHDIVGWLNNIALMSNRIKNKHTKSTLQTK